MLRTQTQKMIDYLINLLHLPRQTIYRIWQHYQLAHHLHIYNQPTINQVSNIICIYASFHIQQIQIDHCACNYSNSTISNVRGQEKECQCFLLQFIFIVIIINRIIILELIFKQSETVNQYSHNQQLHFIYHTYRENISKKRTHHINHFKGSLIISGLGFLGKCLYKSIKITQQSS